MKVYTIGATYRVNKGILNGLEGKLVCYNAKTDVAELEVQHGGIHTTKGVDIDLVDTKVRAPKLRRYIVTIKGNYVVDTLVFEAPQEATAEEIAYALDRMSVGDEMTVGDKIYSWHELEGEVVIGTVQAATPELAKGIFRYSPLLLNVYEIV